ASFAYDAEWLARPDRFALEPALSLGADTFYPPDDRALFGAFGDSAPDRWGRTLLQRAERRRASREHGRPRALHELDYLLGVHDETRQGALRFTPPAGGPWLAEGPGAVPPLVELPRLLAASDQIEGEGELDDALALLLAPGSSLGGARPKASVRDRDSGLAIAKFPKAGDQWPVVQWEMVALELARTAGVRVADARLAAVAGRRVLVVRRFDRHGAARIPFLSAMTLLGARDNDPVPHSYPELAEALRRHGARPTADVRELWRRMVFNILIANTDDHLRNHGVLYAGTDGWILAPAYDLNPTPADIRARGHSTALTLDGDTTGDVDVAFGELEWFSLTLTEARAIANEVRGSVAGWREVARRVGVTKAECDRMASAFE
ncbi:MAG: type II toxin-antitoxin system HipA family toxin, partial [Gemmatimonadales bacterium]